MFSLLSSNLNMKNLVLTVTLRVDSGAESELIEHFNRFKTGKGFQDRGFELRRLLIAGFNSQRSFSEIPEFRSHAIKKNVFAQSSVKPSVYSSNSIEDIYQNSSNKFTGKAASSIPEISSSKISEKLHESMKVIDAVEVDEKRKIEQLTQQNLPALSSLSPVSEIANSKNVDDDMSAAICESYFSLQAQL